MPFLNHITSHFSLSYLGNIIFQSETFLASSEKDVNFNKISIIAMMTLLSLIIRRLSFTVHHFSKLFALLDTNYMYPLTS